MMAATAEHPRGPGGRPMKSDDERRLASTRADLTLAEKQYIRDQAEAAGMTEAAYVRQCALGQPVVVRKAAADARLIHELNAIGVNLNQIARNLNADRRGARAVDLDHLQGRLQAVLDQVLGAFE